MTTMLARRTVSIQWLNTAWGLSTWPRRLSSQGRTMSLEIMVERATQATITMPVAAEAPPRKASKPARDAPGPAAG